MKHYGDDHLPEVAPNYFAARGVESEIWYQDQNRRAIYWDDGSVAVETVSGWRTFRTRGARVRRDLDAHRQAAASSRNSTETA